MFYAKDDTKLVPSEILTKTSVSQHLRDIVEAQSGLMKLSPHLRMQVQLEIMALREFQAGKTTSSAASKTATAYGRDSGNQSNETKSNADARQ